MGHLSNCDKHLQSIVCSRAAEEADHEVICVESNMSTNKVEEQVVEDATRMLSFFPTSNSIGKYIVSDENLQLHDETFVRGVRAILADSLHRVVRPMLRHAREEFSLILES